MKRREQAQGVWLDARTRRPKKACLGNFARVGIRLHGRNAAKSATHQKKSSVLAQMRISANCYAYVGGNPVNMIDPEGLRGLVVRPAPPPRNVYNNPNQLRLPLSYSPGPQPTIRYVPWTSSHAFRAGVTVQTAMWRSVNKWLPDKPEFQEVSQECAVMICGPDVGDPDKASSCPAGDPATGKPYPVMTPTDGSVQCRCL